MEDAALPLHLREQRILAAIAFTDAVNFSARMSEDEEHTLELIRRDLQMMTELCRRFEGQVLKSTGDGLLMYFVSAIQAVTCALEIQKQLAATAAHLPPKDVLSHRIGIHLGDVFFSQTDVMGNGVNVAARLQAVAEPGGICLSQTVYDVVKNGLTLQATYLGPRELKNIQQAVPVYQILLTPTPNSQNVVSKSITEPGSALSREAYRDRQILLNKVRNYWIKGVLETSLQGRALIELGLEEHLNAVERPWQLVWETADTLQQPLPPGMRVIDKFDELGAGRSLLILGDPGSGKTTTLLELTRDVITRAEQDINQPIPVVFNLSSWMGEKQPIAEWLVQELHTKYQVAKEIGQTLVKQQQLLLMLDGLDEVNGGRREACVQALNNFCQAYGQTEIVVCSRIKDYELLSQRLKLQSAICLQPLTDEQIQAYFSSIGAELAGVQVALKSDTTLQELAKSPLMLSIMTLAYQGRGITELPQMHSIEERRQHLFNAYIERMFKHRGVELQYSKEQAIAWLIYLGQKLMRTSQTVFLIERLQPDWLSTKAQRILYSISIGLVGALGAGLGGGINVGMIAGTKGGIIAGAILGLGGGLIAGLVFGLISDRIKPVATLKWSWAKAKDNLRQGLVVGLIFALIFGGSTALVSRMIADLSITLNDIFTYTLSGLGAGLIFVLLHALTGAGIETSTCPNQGIWQSVKNALFFGLLAAIGLGIVAQVADLPLLFGVIAGVLFGLFGAGEACLKHFVLRLLLYYNGYIPWNYARFLDWATERILLQKVGGGYIFIHRLLLEHFAQMQPTQ